MEDFMDEPPKKKQKRGIKKENEDLYRHFRKLDEKFVSTKGKVSNHWLCLCRYCEAEHERYKEGGPRPYRGKLVKIMRCRRDCTTHLRNCSAYKQFLEENDEEIPPAFRKVNIKVESPSAASVALEVEPTPDDNSNMTSSKTKEPSRKSLTPRTPITSKQQKMSQALSSAESGQVGKFLVEFIIVNDLPFSIAQNPAFKRLIDAIRPVASVSLPGLSKLKGALLKKASDDAVTAFHTEIKKTLDNGHRAGMAIDASTDSVAVYVDSVLLSVGGRSFPLDPVEKGWESNALAGARGFETLIGGYEYTVSYFCSNDEGQSVRARRILALRHPFIIWNRCWANQVHLMAKSLFSLSQLKSTCDQAIASAKAVTGPGNAWGSKLVSAIDDLYDKPKAKKIDTVQEMNWSSAQSCFATLLRVQSSCKIFAISGSSADAFPSACSVWADDSFWFRLTEVERLVRPFCEAFFLMEREGNTMAHVMLMFLSLYRRISEIYDDNHEAKILVDIERRWKREENPLFFLAFALHPAFRATASSILKESTRVNGNWSRKRNPLSVARLVRAAKFYYGKFELHGDGNSTDLGEELAQLGRQVSDWLNDRGFDELPAYKNKENVVQWWRRLNAEYPEIASLATFLLDAPVQVATCGDHFKKSAGVTSHGQHDSVTLSRCNNVKHYIRSRYPEDYLPGPCASAAQQLRIVAADEYQTSRAADEDDARDEDEEKVRVKRRGGSVRSERDSAASEEDRLYQEGGERIRRSDETEVDFWIRVLEGICDDEDSPGDRVEAKKADKKDDHEDDDDGEPEEDMYEKKQKDLPSLSDMEMEDCPEENEEYFSKKNYVRKDKYSLSVMACGEITLPRLIPFRL